MYQPKYATKNFKKSYQHLDCVFEFYWLMQTYFQVALVRTVECSNKVYITHNKDLRTSDCIHIYFHKEKH